MFWALHWFKFSYDVNFVCTLLLGLIKTYKKVKYALRCHTEKKAIRTLLPTLAGIDHWKEVSNLHYKFFYILQQGPFYRKTCTLLSIPHGLISSYTLRYIIYLYAAYLIELKCLSISNFNLSYWYLLTIFMIHHYKLSFKPDVRSLFYCTTLVNKVLLLYFSYFAFLFIGKSRLGIKEWKNRKSLKFSEFRVNYFATSFKFVMAYSWSVHIGMFYFYIEF